MVETISVHSFRPGAGRTQIGLSIAAVLYMQGQRVCLIDANIAAPSMQILLGVESADTPWYLNDYLHDECDIADTIVDISPAVEQPGPGRLFLVPANAAPAATMRAHWTPHIADRLSAGYQRLARLFNLDVVLLDTEAGLSNGSLLTLGISDTAAVVFRPDRQDFQGTALLVDLARSLEIERLALVVNELPSGYDVRQAKESVEKAFQAQVAGMIPFSEDLVAADLPFPLHHPDHPLTEIWRVLTDQLIRPER